MPEFNLDRIKNTWQEQEMKPKYNSTEIIQMLNKKSRNYVKYILWISILEFFIFLFITVLYLVQNNESSSILNILERFGVKKNEEVIKNYEHLYFTMKIISLLVTAFFVVKFYINYKKINIESNLKKFILQIVNFKRTVNLFILTNIVLLIIFSGIFIYFVFNTLHSQNIQLNQNTFVGFLIGFLLTTLLSLALILLYYRLVYGIIMKRLSRNLKQLQEIDQNNEE